MNYEKLSMNYEKPSMKIRKTINENNENLIILNHVKTKN